MNLLNYVNELAENKINLINYKSFPIPSEWIPIPMNENPNSGIRKVPEISFSLKHSHRTAIFITEK